MLALVAVSVVIFLATQVLPGDPAAAILGKSATPAAIKSLDQRLGYDHPLLTRYTDWFGGVLRGNLGNSSTAVAAGDADPSVWNAIHTRATNTAILALLTVALLIPLSLLLGVVSAIRAGRLIDNVVTTATVVFVSLPEFVVGALLIALFFAWLNLLPSVSLITPGSSPLSSPKLLVLPVLTLLLTSLGWTIRYVRSGMIEVLDSDYVQMARLNGFNERTVLWRYALRNALAPSIQIFAIVIQYLFGGVIVVEAVYAYPGLGSSLVDAVHQHDVPTIQSIAFIFGAIYIAINILADLVVVMLLPKLRTQV